MASPPASPALRRPRRVLAVLGWLLIGVLLLPYAVVPLYRVVDPVSTVMIWRRLSGHRLERMFVPLGRISPALPRAVIAAEDGRFCSHHGVDWRGLRRAFDEAEDISDMRGGSTISQQVAKNLFLWPGRSYVRKVLELPLALWLDLVLGKRRVMEIYLNIAEWGPTGQFGAEAAARRAFGKSAREIDAREAAVLAALLPNPRRRAAATPVVRRLSGLYQRRAARLGTLAACVTPVAD